MKDTDLDSIKELVKDGVLGEELCPDPNYWRWPVLRPQDIPEWLESNFKKHGEIRHYWS